MASSPEQRDRALQQANRVRARQAQLRAEIASMTTKAGIERVITAIESGEVDSFPVDRLLMSIHGIAHSKMNRLLIYADIRFASRRVDSLTDRQRSYLVRVLRQRART